MRKDIFSHSSPFKKDLDEGNLKPAKK